MLKLDDAVIGIKEVPDYRHMKFCRYILRIISGWPGQILGEKTLKFEWMLGYYNFILSNIYFAMGLLYLKLHVSHLSIFELTHTYITLLMNVVTSTRAGTLCISEPYRTLAAKFIQEIHLFHYKDKSEFAMKVHVKMHQISHYTTLYYAAATTSITLLFCVTPISNNYLSGKYEGREELVNRTFEHAVYLTYPFNADTAFNGYIAATIFTCYGTFLCVNGVCIFDLFLSLMVFSLYGHFKILINLLETFPSPKGVGNEDDSQNGSVSKAILYSEEEQKQVSARLKYCVNYHRFLVAFIGEMSDVFGYTLLTYLCFHQVSGCLLLLQCSQLTARALSRYLPLTIVMFVELIQLCFIFETIGTMTGNLKDAVYNLPWEYMDTGNRKIVFILLVNVQEPILISAAGLVTVGVKTMASILKTSFSYFFFLKTFSE